MGISACGCYGAGSTMFNQEFDKNFGKNWDDVTELHHTHRTHGMGKHFTIHDKFMR